MPRLLTTEDIRPLSEFRANAASLLAMIRENGRPMVLTQHGRGTAVLLDVRTYEALIEQVELTRDVRLAEAQIERGEGVPQEEALTAVMARVRP